MTEMVTASVPVDWLHLFIGHRVWSKPESMGWRSFADVLQMSHVKDIKVATAFEEI